MVLERDDGGLDQDRGSRDGKTCFGEERKDLLTDWMQGLKEKKE